MKNLLFLFVAAVVNICAFAQASLEEIAATPGKGVAFITPIPSRKSSKHLLPQATSRFILAIMAATARGISFPTTITLPPGTFCVVPPMPMRSLRWVEISSPDLIPCGLRLKGAVANFRPSECVSTEA